MTTRKGHFLQYYNLSVLLMKLAQTYLEYTKDFIPDRAGALKRTMEIAATSQATRIADVTLKLKKDLREDLVLDMGSEEAQALGSILHEMILTPNLLELEAELVEWIRAKREKIPEDGAEVYHQ